MEKTSSTIRIAMKPITMLFKMILYSMMDLINHLKRIFLRTKTPPSGFMRKLNNDELYWHLASSQGNSIISYTFFVSSHHELRETTIRKHLRILMDLHPMLRMRIVKIQDGGDLFWAEVDRPEPDVQFQEGTCISKDLKS